jgi:alpha-beta hydrolase superfamily lysophospholipase
VWILLGKQKDNEDKIREAAFCYRAAEFFVEPKDSRKSELYEMFVDRFYKHHQIDVIQIHEIPYKTGALHTMHLKPENPKGTFVLHGGGDSFAEEFYPYMLYFHNRGYEVINFEGPGQGSTLHRHHIGFEWQWEHATKAVLDYFRIEECALMGISMGGWMCVRAASQDPRIAKLISFNSLTNLYKGMTEAMPQEARKFYSATLEGEDKATFNAVAEKASAKDSFAKWMHNNTMFTFLEDNPYDANRHYLDYVPKNLEMEKIKADVLLTTCVEDHFVLNEFMDEMKLAMVNASSIETRTFLREEQASHHCAVGNQQLALTVMADWLDRAFGY